MRLTKYYLNTLKEDPKESDIISQKLLTRAGMIKKIASGIYTFLPLGYKVLRKIENIIRQEMNDAGAIELNMPIIQPAELWIQSQRYQKMGAEMWRIKDRNNHDFVLGPTHEEVISEIVKSVQLSYKNLPFNLYQIQTKVRDERRPRFGLMRAREFLMKDGYSFHENLESAKREFENMQKAYKKILERLNLKYRAVVADSGAMGGNNSVEFQVLAESGEDQIVYCEHCGYGANQEKAVAKLDEIKASITNNEKVLTKDITSLDQLSKYFNVPTTNFIKCLIYQDINKKIFYKVLIRGDLEVNEVKLKNILECDNLVLIEDKQFEKLNLIKGYLGPKSEEELTVIADESILTLDYQIVGSNHLNYHVTGVQSNQYQYHKIADIALVAEGMSCSICGHKLSSDRGIEVGHVFILGDKYSKTMDIKYLNNQGKTNYVQMGCYGIGVSRLLAAIVEQCNDDNGIIWPAEVAPFEVVVIPVNNNYHFEDAQRIYQELLKEGIDALFDDRNERVGFKLKDADLIGYPIKIIIGDKIKDNMIEFKTRRGTEELIPLEQLMQKIKSNLI